MKGVKKIASITYNSSRQNATVGNATTIKLWCLSISQHHPKEIRICSINICNNILIIATSQIEIMRPYKIKREGIIFYKPRTRTS